MYIAAFKKWQVWASKHALVRELPASPQHVALYLVFLSNTATSFSTIKLAASSIAWAHSIAGFSSPTIHSLVAETLAGLKFRLARPKLPKEPFTVGQINSLMAQRIVTCLTDTRNVCLISLAFFGFFRFSEITRIKVNHLKFFVSHVEITIEKSKCDQLRLGNVVVISRLGTHCPVSLLESYMELANSASTPTFYLFRRVVVKQSNKLLHENNLPLSYGSTRDIVKSKATSLGLNPQCFGTHSMRAGGSSAAANNGVADRIFQRHGRWSSVAAKDGYIKDSLKSRLSVTQMIGHA